jgi:hypothetical protein
MKKKNPNKDIINLLYAIGFQYNTKKIVATLFTETTYIYLKNKDVIYTVILLKNSILFREHCGENSVHDVVLFDNIKEYLFKKFPSETRKLKISKILNNDL